jgi:predicted GNAT family N-acyltransferase
MQDRGLSKLYVLAQKGEEAFFHSMGYSVEGDSFEEYGISYQRMSKQLLLSA